MAFVSGDPTIDLGGEGGAYSPAPPSGGPATNMAASSASYGTTSKAMTGLIVGWQKGPGAASPNIPSAITGAKNFTKTPITMTPVQLLAAFDQFSQKDYLRFRNLLIAAGYVSETADAMTVRSAYQGLLYDTLDMQSSGVTVTPMQLVKNLIRKNGLEPSKIGSDEDFNAAIKEQLQPSSQTTTSVYDLTPEDARATLEGAMAQKLGRAPTSEEIEDFIAAAQTRADRNPTRVTQSFNPGASGGTGDEVTVQREGGEVVGTTVTNVDEGFDADSLGRMAERRAKNAPDYASYQAVATLFPAFIQALGSTV